MVEMLPATLLAEPPKQGQVPNLKFVLSTGTKSKSDTGAGSEGGSLYKQSD